MWIGRVCLCCCGLALAIPVYWPMAGTAVAATFVDATNGNTAVGTAQAIDENPGLLVKQVTGNTSFAKAQKVTPSYHAADAVGQIAAGHPSEFYSISVVAGQTISIEATAQHPSSQFPELLLFDQNLDLVAIAAGNAPDGSSAVIQFTVPDGYSGVWFAQVVGSSNAPDPATNFFAYTFHVFSPIAYRTDVLGVYGGIGKSGFYGVAVNAGDNLLFNVSAANPGKQSPELLLYDPSGNLVAVAAGNSPDGSSSVIGFSAPSAGTWVIEVSGNPSAPGVHFNYELRVQGETGSGPLDPLTAH